MPKKTLKRIRTTVQTKFEDLQPDIWVRVRDIVFMLGAGSGIIVGILWLGGRFYASGYFARLGIPLYFLDFSIWEYGENYIITIIVNVITFIFDNFWAGVTEIIGLAIVFAILWFIQKRWRNLKIEKAFDVIYHLNKWVFAAVLPSLFILLILSFFSAYRQGDKDAGDNLTNARSVTVYSKAFLALPSPSVVVGANPDSSLYQFTGLHLLTYNSGKYYFFRDLEQDHKSCKPKQVFVIEDNGSINIVIDGTPATPLPCPAPPSAMPTSTP